MKFLERLPIPRRLSSRLWLITLPSALISFERRSDVPRLPAGGLRLLGLPLVAGGLALGLFAHRQPNTSIAYGGPLAPLSRQPATAGGLLALAGVAVLLRSLVLTAYALGLAVAVGTSAVEVEEPGASTLLGRRRD